MTEEEETETVRGDEPPTMETLKITNICSHPFKIYIDGAYKGRLLVVIIPIPTMPLIPCQGRTPGHYQYPLIYEIL